jgi:hypothetical protein
VTNDVIDFKLSRWFIVNVDPTLGCWQHLEMGCVVEFSEELLPLSSPGSALTLLLLFQVKYDILSILHLQQWNAYWLV